MNGLIANGSCITVFPVCSAAAVASDLRKDPVKIPCSHDLVSNTRGTPCGLRPPKMIAYILKKVEIDDKKRLY